MVNAASLELNSLQAKLIAKNMTGITNLNIGSNRICSEGTWHIVRHMPVLFNLNLESNFITSEGAESIGKLLPRVLILILKDNFINCNGALRLVRNTRLIQ